MPRRSSSESTEPLAGRLGPMGTAKAAGISRKATKSRCAGKWGGWGRLSEDGLGQHNPDRSEGPWGRAAKPLARQCRWRVYIVSTQSEGGTAPKTARRSEANHGGGSIASPYLGKAPTESRPWSRIGENPPYGILGGTMETSASFEARLAPSSNPTAYLREEEEQRTVHGAAADDTQAVAGQAE
jgi:hypothetical protein